MEMAIGTFYFSARYLKYACLTLNYEMRRNVGGADWG